MLIQPLKGPASGYPINRREEKPDGLRLAD